MRNCIVLLLIVSLSLDAANAQPLYPDTTMVPDSGWYIFNWDAVRFPDSSQTELAIADSLFEEELPWECGGTQDFVPELSTSNIIVFNERSTPVITFITNTFAFPIWEICGDPHGKWINIADPYKGWHEIDLFNQDTSRRARSISSFSETNAKQISSSAPPETPDPPKPVPIPEQPWYECILARAIRVTTRYST